MALMQQRNFREYGRTTNGAGKSHAGLVSKFRSLALCNDWAQNYGRYTKRT